MANINEVVVMAALVKALGREENLLENGKYNWNYVEADLYLELRPNNEEERELIDVMMNGIANLYEE